MLTCVLLFVMRTKIQKNKNGLHNQLRWPLLLRMYTTTWSISASLLRFVFAKSDLAKLHAHPNRQLPHLLFLEVLEFVSGFLRCDNGRFGLFSRCLCFSCVIIVDIGRQLQISYLLARLFGCPVWVLPLDWMVLCSSSGLTAFVLLAGSIQVNTTSTNKNIFV